MFELLKHRKRRRRLSIQFLEEEMENNTVELESSSPSQQQRSTSTRISSRRIRTLAPTTLHFDASRDRDPAETETETGSISSTKRRTTRSSSLYRSLIVATTTVALLFGSINIDPANSFQTTRQQQARCSSSSSLFPLSMSLATPPSSTSSINNANTNAIPSKTELESMKVADLKQLIKDSGFNERGLLSKLKKKQDLVDFLTEQEQAPEIGVSSPRKVVIQQTTTTPTPPPPPSPKQQPRKMPITMPKKKPPTTANPAAADASDQQQQNQKQQSPMTNLFEKIHDQYPPLQYLQEGNKTLLGELDIRQRYHPMLQAGNQVALSEEEEGYGEEADNDDNDENASLSTSAGDREKGFKPALSGDMDLIFVGTASCTPSITRGVSCTALRLHSLASSASSSNKKKQQQYDTKGGQQEQTQSFDVAQNSQSNLGTWLFDCGESTQLQIQKTSSIRPSKITKIFLTHAHGDHSFGLPGLLCIMGQDTAGGNEAGERGPNGENIRKTKDSKAPIDIYGPEGLRLWLRTAIRYSVSRIVPKYRVHELKDVAMAPEWGYSPKWEKYFFNKAAFYERKNADDPNKRNNVNVNSRNNGAANEYYWGAANHKRRQSLSDPRMRGQSSDWLSLCEQGAPMIEPSELYGEVEGGRDIYPIFDHPQSSDGAPVWEVEHEGGGDGDEKSSSGDGDDVNSGVRVYAAPMSHGVPCVGYVVQEANRPGRLRDELVKPICQRNIPALKAAGFRHPMKALAVIKDLPEGGSFTFPDGTVVTQEEAVEPTRPGRKVVICGDTNSARSLEKLAENADVVVHEATNTFLHALDRNDSNFNSVTKEAIFHGHSTPHIAGDFAKRVKAKRLILNHFSARYMGDQSIESISIMTRIEQQAMKASGLTRSDVAAAWDFMIFPIPKAYQKKASSLNSSDGEGDNEVETTA